MKQCQGQTSLFSAVASLDHASHLVLPGSKEARKMTVTSGLRCLELSKKSGPLGLLEKMLLESLRWHSTRCYLTWKVSVTPAKRLLFRLAPSMPRIGGTGVQSLETKVERWKRNIEGVDGQPILWKTPIASDAANRGFYRNSRGEPNLSGMVKLWPTPSTGAGLCGGTGNFKQLQKLKEQGQITEEERKSMLQGNGGQLNPEWVEWLMGFPPGWTEL